MILNRQEFAEHFNRTHSGLGDKNSPLWEPEERLSRNNAVAFICVTPIRVLNPLRNKTLFWEWCRDHLQGKVFCYSCDTINGEEWWGFTDESDIVLWVLKWT